MADNALKTGATGRYVDGDDNTYAVIVVGPHFEVRSPGNNQDGSAKPPCRCEVAGKVRAKLINDHGEEKFAVIDASKVEV